MLDNTFSEVFLLISSLNPPGTERRSTLCSGDGHPVWRVQASDVKGTPSYASCAREQAPCAPSVEGQATEGTAPPSPRAEVPGPAAGAALPGGSAPGAAEPFHRDLLPPACPQHRRPPGPGFLPVPASLGPCLCLLFPGPSPSGWLFPHPAPEGTSAGLRADQDSLPPRSRKVPREPGRAQGELGWHDHPARAPISSGHPSHQDNRPTKASFLPGHPFHHAILPGTSAPLKLKPQARMYPDPLHALRNCGERLQLVPALPLAWELLFTWELLEILMEKSVQL